MTQQSLFGMVRNVTVCPDCKGKGKIIKENVRIAMVQVIFLTERKLRSAYLRVLIMDRE